MKIDDDPVETMTIEDESGSGIYEVSRSEKSQFQASTFVDSILASPALEGDEAENVVAEMNFEALRIFLIKDAQKRLRLPES